MLKKIVAEEFSKTITDDDAVGLRGWGVH